MQLDELDKLNNKIDEICALLNPEDAYWIKDLLVKCYQDEDVLEQVIEMMVAMGYGQEIIFKVGELVEKLQTEQ